MKLLDKVEAIIREHAIERDREDDIGGLTVINCSPSCLAKSIVAQLTKPTVEEKP